MSSHSPSPSPGVQRKLPSCRTCGLPMRGHQRGTCVYSPDIHPQTSSPLMPPPDTIPSGPSQLGARFSAPNERPIMPGSYGNDRPSEISVSSGPSPRLSLRDRIGAKIEEQSAIVPPYAGDMRNLHYSRHASEPLETYPAMFIGGSGAGYAASASGSAYGSSSTIVMPEHSISQRNILRDRKSGTAGYPPPQDLLDRLGGYGSDEYPGADNSDYADDFSVEYNGGYDDDEEDDSDPAYPSDGSAIGGGASASSYNESESDAGTFSTSGRSSAPSFSALIRSSGASPLWTVYEVGTKYVPYLRNRARQKGLALSVLRGSQGDYLDGDGRRKKSSREPGNVQIILGRDEDAVKQVTQQVRRNGSVMPDPNNQFRNRARSTVDDIQAQYYSPHHSPTPQPFQSPYPTPHPALAYPPPIAPVQPQPTNWWRALCLIVSTILVLIFLVFFVLVYVIFVRSSESE